MRRLEDVDLSTPYCHSDEPRRNNWPLVLDCFRGSIRRSRVWWTRETEAGWSARLGRSADDAGQPADRAAAARRPC